jgi:tRNA(Leu) C34 or U34 (ribose-2'-O)-methylase TrmL
MAGPVRSLNLATAVGIVLYEAIRQTRYLEATAPPQLLATDEHG